MPATYDAARARRARQRHKALVAYGFLAPSLIVFIVFRQVPAVASFLLGFYNWDLLNTPTFIGLDNYARLVHDDIFWRSLENTVKYTLLAVPPDIVLALGMALLLNQGLRGTRLFRLAYFSPVVTSTAIIAIVWRWLYQPTGIVNGVLEQVGLPTRLWLADPDLALLAIAIMSIWQHVGFNMLIFLAGLQAIPVELEEAARVDGAGRGSIFRNVTLPLLRPVIVLTTILTTIGSLKVFDAAYVMTGGGPYYATTTLVYYTYTKAFIQYQMGYAAAVAFVLFCIILTITLLQRWVFKGDESVY